MLTRFSSFAMSTVDEYMNHPMRHSVRIAEAIGPRACAQLGDATSLVVASAQARCRRASEVRCSHAQLAQRQTRSQVAA